ncbi:unnamed protein product [Adineta ricciae]|uniref:Uncharacterized protein n=1 Tax=Adineta ricciae TaxID=249248 RepID=A0A816AWQ5_ADIRI|nr:unnamed protein product [Adineta ricciae]
MLPIKRLVQLTHSLFGFKQIHNNSKEIIVLDICGDKYELSTKLSTRLPLTIVLSMCLMLLMVILTDGCIFSMRLIYPNELCSDEFSYCYIFQSRFSLYKVVDQFACQPSEPVISSNVSASHALCYGFILPNQTTIDVLNQLGICTGILSIVRTLYPCIYRLARHRIGTICLIFVILGILATEIILIILQFNISYVTLTLVSLILLLLTTIILIHFKRRFIVKHIEKKIGVDLNNDGVIGSTRHHVHVSGYYAPDHRGETLVDKLERKTHVDINGDGHIGKQHFNQSGGQGLLNELEKATNIDLNGDGRIGNGPNYRSNHSHYRSPPPPHFNQAGSNSMISELERATNIDLNHDGVIGGPSRPPPFNPYHGPPPNFNSANGNSMINELEKATNIDLNHDGRIGGGPNYPPNYPPFGGPPPPPSYGQPGGGGSMINELERATNIDLNGDGRIGGGPSYPPPNFPPYGGPPYNGPPPPNFNQYGGNSMINELEKATNIDLNHDGRIGGGPSYPPNYPPFGGPPPPPSYGQPGGGSSMISELERATNIDLNGDGRIGGGPSYPPSNFPPYGGPPYNGPPPPPPNFNQYGGNSMINELERATNIDLNGDGRIGGGPSYPPPNFPPYGGPPYNGPPPPNFNQHGGNSMINELERATNIDLNGDGRIGGPPNNFPNYNQYR